MDSFVRRFTLVLPGLFLLLLLLPMMAGPGGCARDQDETADLDVAAVLGDDSGAANAGFARALEVRKFHFPEDHGAHPDYRHEWWYLTGNLNSDDGGEFGYQVTFFRIALAPESDAQTESRPSRWATRQVWMAHAAVTDNLKGIHHQEQRLSRDALRLAGITADPFRVWLDDWQIVSTGADFPWHLRIKARDFALNLQVQPMRDILLQGDRGLSRKSSATGNASYYYSITRLDSTGTLQIADRQIEVTGLSWLDREWSTSALGPDQAGWDWFSLQLDSGEDLMYYRLRKTDGSTDPLSSGSWLDASGRISTLGPSTVSLEPLHYWQDPIGERYPVRWRLRLREPERNWLIVAPVQDQLMDTLVRYWEGSVNVMDADTGERVGRGYLEMTGY